MNYTVVPRNSGYFKYSAIVKAQNGEELGKIDADSKWDFNRRLRKIIRDYETQRNNMQSYYVDSTGKRVVNNERGQLLRGADPPAGRIHLHHGVRFSWGGETREAKDFDPQYLDIWAAYRAAINDDVPAEAGVIFHPECGPALRDYWGPRHVPGHIES